MLMERMQRVLYGEGDPEESDARALRVNLYAQGLLGPTNCRPRANQLLRDFEDMVAIYAAPHRVYDLRPS